MVRTVLQQEGCHFCMTVFASHDQRCALKFVFSQDFCSLIKQELTNFVVTLSCCKMQRLHPVLALPLTDFDGA